MNTQQAIHTQEFISYISENERLIYKVCAMFCKDTEDRKDLFQEIVLQAWRSYGGFHGQSAFGTWLYKVSLNTAVVHQRKGKRNVVAGSAELPDIYPQEHLDTAAEEQYRVMYRMISELPALEKALVMLYMDDYSYQQIADIVGISASNVGTKLNRIKDKLKKQANSYNK